MKRKTDFIFFCVSFLLIAMGFLAPTICYAQDCSTSLRDAQHSYEGGDFRKVIAILSPCIKNNLNFDDTWRGYRLMAISYLLLDDPDSGDICLRAMLNRNPLYAPNPSIDPDEFIKAVSEYEYYPKLSIGVQGGILDPQIKLLSPNSVTQVYSTQNNYRTKISSALGVDFEYHLLPFLPSLALIIGGVLTPVEFSRTNQPVIGKNVTYTESISSISIPLLLHLDLIREEFKPFIEAGAFAQFLSSATGSFAFNNSLPGSTGSATGVLPLTNINSLDRRKGANYGFLIGMGMAKTFANPLSELRLSVHYWNGLKDITNSGARYSNPMIYQTFYFVDDEIALHGFEVSLNFIFHLSLAQFHEHE